MQYVDITELIQSMFYSHIQRHRVQFYESVEISHNAIFLSIRHGSCPHRSEDIPPFILSRTTDLSITKQVWTLSAHHEAPKDHCLSYEVDHTIMIRDEVFPGPIKMNSQPLS